MKNYIDLVKNVLEQGKWKPNRTGIDALTISGAMIQHSMVEGAPLLTTKKMAFKSVKVELEFFIKGLTDKGWLQKHGCSIWDEWCNPQKIPPELNQPEKEEEKKRFQLKERDLGRIYGYQWNNFNGVNQIKKLIETLKKDPHDRRMIVSAWNPVDLPDMALPPCHVLFHVTVIDNQLNLTWFQRSCDLALGIPFNLASYGLLLHLLALESGLEEGILTGMLSDVHIYKNHLEPVREQIARPPLPLGKMVTHKFDGFWNWQHADTEIENYQSHEKIFFPIAV